MSPSRTSWSSAPWPGSAGSGACSAVRPARSSARCVSSPRWWRCPPVARRAPPRRPPGRPRVARWSAALAAAAGRRPGAAACGRPLRAAGPSPARLAVRGLGGATGARLRRRRRFGRPVRRAVRGRGRVLRGRTGSAPGCRRSLRATGFAPASAAVGRRPAWPRRLRAHRLLARAAGRGPAGWPRPPRASRSPRRRSAGRPRTAGRASTGCSPPSRAGPPAAGTARRRPRRSGTRTASACS